MYDDRAAYDQSKLANLLFTLELNDRLQNTDVKVYSVDPGVVDTELLKHTSFEKSTTAKYLVGPVFKTFMKTPAMGAQTIIKCCVDESISDQNGKYFRYGYDK
jgi:NAD(P)-dependent dehydrogenase (short-subunit alcohol dehydrogenase family)